MFSGSVGHKCVQIEILQFIKIAILSLKYCNLKMLEFAIGTIDLQKFSAEFNPWDKF